MNQKEVSMLRHNCNLLLDYSLLQQKKVISINPNKSDFLVKIQKKKMNWMLTSAVKSCVWMHTNKIESKHNRQSLYRQTIGIEDWLKLIFSHCIQFVCNNPNKEHDTFHVINPCDMKIDKKMWAMCNFDLCVLWCMCEQFQFSLRSNIHVCVCAKSEKINNRRNCQITLRFFVSFHTVSHCWLHGFIFHQMKYGPHLNEWNKHLSDKHLYIKFIRDLFFPHHKYIHASTTICHF